MILDYNFSREKKEMCISYIDETGNKQLLQFKNLNKFSTYQYDPQGKYTTWNGCKASRKFTSNPSKFDIKEFIYNLSPDMQAKLDGRTFPKLYTFDIETQIKSKYEFTDPTVADQPILTISMVNPDLDCVVLGTKNLDKDKIDGIQQMFDDYLKSVEFYNTLKLSKKPQFRYIKFDSEEKMIRYFFEKFVRKVPIIAGWNSIGYDWCYFVHRVKNFYPDLSVALSSINHTTTAKNYTNKLGETIKLQHPNHTLVLDMMEVIDNYDFSVLGMKESMNLDYVASQTLGAHKIDYEGSLQDLYETDYQRYVFYNAIDSILVQLIDKRFKTMNQFYLQGLICKESIGKCFSKIALTEALIFKHFYKEGIKIVYEEREEVERGELMGAYVKEPRAGKWEWMCCNDFASLYPSTMITCNISFENYMGKLGREFTEEDIERFKKDKNYFVSVNNNVYRNDKPYTLKVIEKTLKSERDVNKYLSKRLDATIKRDVAHFMAGRKVEYNEYPKDVKEYIKGVLGIEINTTDDISKIPNITEFNDTLDVDIIYFTGLEQAVKTLMNSIYGGSSHISFYFYNMDMANDITGESRWLILKMESHIPEHFDKEWLGMTELHKQLGIEVDRNKVEECLRRGENMITLIYGDTDSVDSQSIIKTNKGEKTIEQLFLENEHNNKKITQNGHELVGVDEKILNYTADGKLEYQNARYVMRHKVKKQKWRLKTATGKEIFVTNDHSMIVFRDGKKLEVKPYEILKTDKILVVLSHTEYIFDDIEIIECVGYFEDEYVYDIEMVDDTHTFIANDILVHNSLYSSYSNLLKCCKGYDKMTTRQKLDIVLGINLKYLDDHNCEYIKALYDERHGDSFHKFELETVAKAGVWLNVKKRYGQLLMWKDGKFFDEDDLPVKVKGLEVIKASYPTMARKINKDFLKFLLEYDGRYLTQELNLLNLKYIKDFENAPLENICINTKVNKYSSHVIDDRDPTGIKFASKASYNSKALALYNWLNNVHKFGSEPLYGGKVKCYTVRGSNEKTGDTYFAFESMKYPKWADEYAPVDRIRMYDKYVLDPFNRILSAIGMPILNSDGSIQLSMFV